MTNEELISESNDLHDAMQRQLPPKAVLLEPLPIDTSDAQLAARGAVTKLTQAFTAATEGSEKASAALDKLGVVTAMGNGGGGSNNNSGALVGGIADSDEPNRKRVGCGGNVEGGGLVSPSVGFTTNERQPQLVFNGCQVTIKIGK